MTSHPGSSEPNGFVSGEAVELDIRVALVGSRMLAFVLDLVVQLLLLWGLMVGAVLFAAMLATAQAADGALFAGLMTLCVIVAFLVYPTALEALTGGRSLGKLAVGLRVVRDDGGPVRFRHSLVRVLVGFAVDFPGLALPPLTWLASMWTAMAHPYGKRLGDLAAGTLVIHDRNPTAWGWTQPVPPQLRGWALTLDLSGLEDELALAVRRYLTRHHILTAAARTQLCFQLANRVARVVTPPPPPGIAPGTYLAAITGERYRREAERLARRRTIAAQLWPTLGAGSRLSA
ncbi:MAG: RDD family protein [Micromonosporaceae bacterium]